MKDEALEFKRLLNERIKKGVPVMNQWGTVKSVNWAKKTAVVMVDGLEYYDVVLGLGFVSKRPSIGSKCLVGIIENAEGCFLIDADKVDGFELKSGNSTITLDEKGIDIKTNNESLFGLMDDLITEVGAIQVLPGYGTPANPLNITAFKQRLKVISNG